LVSSQERAEKIESYGRAHSVLTEALREFPTEMWNFKPSPHTWSIQELVIHITDSEANSFVRCRRFIAEPGSQVMAYDESRWARDLHYHSQSAGVALELFKWLRMASYNLIKDLPESAWSNTVYHPENGTMTMDDWLDVYERHIPEHVAQMRECYAAWKEQS
jgi:hypothetical protein